MTKIILTRYNRQELAKLRENEVNFPGQLLASSVSWGFRNPAQEPEEAFAYRGSDGF